VYIVTTIIHDVLDYLPILHTKSTVNVWFEKKIYNLINCMVYSMYLIYILPILSNIT